MLDFMYYGGEVMMIRLRTPYESPMGIFEDTDLASNFISTDLLVLLMDACDINPRPVNIISAQEVDNMLELLDRKVFCFDGRYLP